MSKPRGKEYSELVKDLPEFKDTEPSGKDAGMLSKMKASLKKTKEQFINGLRVSLIGERELNDDLLDEIEERLLAADLGVKTTQRILNFLENEHERGNITTEKEVYARICEMITLILNEQPRQPQLRENEPTVFLFVGVNGVGKTTGIGKLAAFYRGQGKKVLIVAGDTFRAAAIEQLETWSNRAAVDIFRMDTGADPAATMYQAAVKGRDENYDILLCDTSGRLHTKRNLIDELVKMKRSLSKNIDSAPHHVVLVLDATNGQNAIQQTRSFIDAVQVDGLMVTKLDSTAKGGVIVGIVNEFDLPVYFIGLGEKIEDLQSFVPKRFASGLLE